MSLLSLFFWTLLLSAIWGLSRVSKKSGSHYQGVVWSCFAWFVLGVLLTRVYLWEPMVVQGNSMSPTLENYQTVVVNKHAFGFKLYPLPWRLNAKEPERGDVVVFKSPDGDYWVKRVMATPGDRISYFPGVGWFNGPDLISTPSQGLDISSVPSRPRWMSYVRPDSVQHQGYLGWSFTIPQGRYFLLGDNHGNSIDSRDIGPVSHTRISGRIDP